ASGLASLETRVPWCPSLVDSRSSRQQPSPQIPLRRLLRVNLDVVPALPKRVDLNSRQCDRAVDVSVGCLVDLEIEFDRTAHTSLAHMHLSDRRRALHALERSVDRQLRSVHASSNCPTASHLSRVIPFS